MTKQELRQWIRTAKSQQDSAALRMWSEHICEKLLSHPKLQTVDTVLIYYPLKDEVDVRPAIDALYNKGIKVLLPKVTGDTTMELRLYEGPASLKKGAFGIMEPIGMTVNNSTLSTLHSPLIIPGMAFDRSGHRLGRGKGYYDRFLSSLITPHSSLYKIGVCYPFQLVDTVPSDDHDIVMDEVIY